MLRVHSCIRDLSVKAYSIQSVLPLRMGELMGDGDRIPASPGHMLTGYIQIGPVARRLLALLDPGLSISISQARIKSSPAVKVLIVHSYCIYSQS
jgi:hypothetical protein